MSSIYLNIFKTASFWRRKNLTPFGIKWVFWISSFSHFYKQILHQSFSTLFSFSSPLPQHKPRQLKVPRFCLLIGLLSPTDSILDANEEMHNPQSISVKINCRKLTEKIDFLWVLGLLYIYIYRERRERERTKKNQLPKLTE